MPINVTVRNAQLTDRPAMRTLATTVVNGSSPFQDLQSDYGDATANFSLADLQARIQDGSYRAAVAFEAPANTVLRGWSMFIHHDGLSGLIPATVPDAWEHAYIITDKTLSLADRLRVVNAIARAAATQVADTTYIWADVKTPGNLDTALAALYAHVTVQKEVVFGGVPSLATFNRYYATAVDVRSH